MTRSRFAGLFGAFLIIFLVNTAYISAFASPTILYMTNVLAHLGLGIALGIAVVILLRRDRTLRSGAGLTLVFFVASLLLGLFLAWKGNILQNRWALWSHILVGSLALASFVPFVRRRAAMFGGGWKTFKRCYQFGLGLLILLPAATLVYGLLRPDPRDRIVNPMKVPTSMDEEGGGPKSPFFPASAQTNVGGIIPANFFMDSARCGECHKDIYEQWNSSAHHFASFNNQFYRKSVEYMQGVVGTRPSKWCAGCHDHAVFFNGRFERPIREQIDTPEAHAGLSCTSCHAITHVGSSMGNNGFTIEYPPLHEIATSRNPFVRTMDNFLTYLDPEPHRRTFMKPFMRSANGPEFCSSCHKVHLDLPVNNYRWFRGFNEYDNWQASGVSGQGARSFYYPAQSQTCADCHMPLVDSQDPGNRDGKVHSHRFPAANTALAYVNEDARQMEAIRQFLTSGFISVDIFAVSPLEETKNQMIRRSAGEGQQAMSSFGVGEEAEIAGPVFIREVGNVSAPVDMAGAKLVPGSTARVDVVVRTRKIGHFFPGGTVDAFDVWLELQGRDGDGKVIFWSGQVTDGGRGPVEPGAHMYKSYMVDAAGNPIDKRNAWQGRAVLYVRLIPPGAADVVHYRVKVPKGVKGPVTFTAKLNYRKFSWYYTQFAYAGVPKPGQDASLLGPNYNSLDYSFDIANIPANVSGKIKGAIPSIPIIVLAQDEVRIPVGESTEWKQVTGEKIRERWNDWGIGLLLQGDLKGAEYAFKKVTESDPLYADGWLNVARALIQEGETDGARPYINKALQVNPSLGRIWYFKALVEKADGDYDSALESLGVVLQKYPRDRVALNQAARVLFLKREYRKALERLEQVCLVDPEDVQMHYTAMLCYRGLGDAANAAREEKLFRRFKLDESAQVYTAKRRMISPEDNNERQQIHEHESVPLDLSAPPGDVRAKIAAARPVTAGEGSK
jgi:tetratricopeptide (TPR) repeat protein